jgi:hypothetical protein
MPAYKEETSTFFNMLKKSVCFLFTLAALNGYGQIIMKDSMKPGDDLIICMNDARNPSIFIFRDSAADYSNYFEGVVTYMIRYESSDPAIQTVDLAAANGTMSEFYFKGGNYLQRSNGRHKYAELYLWKENKFYEQAVKGDTIKWLDCSKKNEFLTNLEVTENFTEMIMDHKCKMLKMETNDFSGQKYRTGYYSFCCDLKIDPNWFQKCRYRTANKMYAKTESIPLKISYIRNNYKVIMTAIKLEKRKLDNAVFELDRKAILTQLKPE